MRIPFITGFLERRRRGGDRARMVLPQGKLPRPIPGPWVLRAVVREGDAGKAPTRPVSAPAGTPPGGPPGS